MNVTFHYTAVRRPEEPGKIYGLQVAILDVLRAWLRFGGQERFPFLIEGQQDIDEINDVAREIGFDLSRLDFLDARFPRDTFHYPDVVFRPDPNSYDIFWQRALTERDFPFCGLVHAFSGREAMQVLEKYCLAPTTSQDALICPSHAIADVIQRGFEHIGAYYEKRFGQPYHCPVKTEVIPLGVDIPKIKAKVSPEKRKSQREVLGIGVDEIILLWVGRMSYAIKAHPIAMYRAAEEAAKRTNKKVHLVMQGYFIPEESGEEFKALATDVCKTVQVHFIASNDERFPDGLWAAGDIFLSLIDNVQESFGLTPIEAIAAGLPRVISDWDGYRDSVSHGEDGFLVPSLMPPPDMGRELAITTIGKRETYGGYLAMTASSAFIDHHAAAKFISHLIDDPSLRQRMAAKAKERLLAYEWPQLIKAYENLWHDLPRRQKEEVTTPRDLSKSFLLHPHVPDPYTLYQSFPSEKMREDMVLGVTAGKEEMEKIFSHKMNTLLGPFLVRPEDVFPFLQKIAATNKCCASDVFEAFPAYDKATLWRTLAWLLKLGIISRV